MSKRIGAIILVALFFVFTGVADAAEYVKVKKTTMQEIKLKLEKLKAIEDAKPSVKLANFKVTVDEKNRVFVQDSVDVELDLASLNYTGEVKLKADYYYKPVLKKESKFSSFGLLYAAVPENLESNKLVKGQLFLYYDLVKIRKFALNPVVNTLHYGIGLGYNVTGNSKVIGGAVWKYGEKFEGKNAMPFAGYGFNF